MLVEINLLPEREPKKFTFVIILSSLIALILIVSGFYFMQIHSTKSDIDSVNQQISVTRKIAAKETSTTNTTQATNSVGQLETAIKWAKDYPIQTIPVMQQLTSLLPERGFIQSFAYTEAGTVQLTVQFDSAREAAYFLNNLNGAKWVQDASLNSLNASATTDTNTIGTASTQSSQTTVGQTTGNAATGGTAPTGVTPNQTGTTTITGAAGNTSNQTSVGTVNQTNQNAATTSTVDQNSDKYLPRYIGQFEITLNKDEIKKLSKENTNDEEGVTGS